MRKNRIERIVVGLDGSDQSRVALEWAIGMAHGMGSEVIAVHAVHPVVYWGPGYSPPPQFDPEWRRDMKAVFEGQWCRPLRDAGIRYRAFMVDGRPAPAIAEVADREDADLIVVGRRGRGGVAELLLGSVSHELTHDTSRPVLLISPARTDGAREPAAAAQEKA